jgi:hypothetical protein
LGITAVVGIVVVVVVLLLPTAITSHTLEETIAKQLGVKDSRYLHLNLPPADGRYPGSVFRMEPQVVPVHRTADHDPAIRRTDSAGSIVWTGDLDAKGSGTIGANGIKAMLQNARELEVSVTVQSCKVLDMDLAELQKRLHLSDSEDEKAKHAVIIRAWEGQLTLDVTFKGDMVAWANRRKDIEKKGNDMGVSITAGAKNTLQLSWPGTVIFAFEVSAPGSIGATSGGELQPVSVDQLHLPVWGE